MAQVKSAVVVFILSLLFILLIGGCFLKDNKKTFAQPVVEQIGVDENNQPHPEERALILLSDPQVYRRETLINDRLREINHLKVGLDKANWETAFHPQLLRDLSDVSSFAASVGLNFDPLAGLKGEHQQKILEGAIDREELAQQIDIVKLEADLLRVRNQLEELREDKSKAEPSASATAPTAVPGTTTSISASKPAPKALANLQSAIENLHNKISKLDKTQTSASPEDQYEDLAAYRAKLRADLAATRLDDVHDIDGNALYRIQFSAHLFPQDPSNRWGVLETEIHRPELTDDDIREIYFTWLAHQTARLNVIGKGGKNIHAADFPMRLGRGSRLYDVAKLKFPIGHSSWAHVHVATMYKHAKDVEAILGQKIPSYMFQKKDADYAGQLVAANGYSVKPSSKPDCKLEKLFEVKEFKNSKVMKMQDAMKAYVEAMHIMQLRLSVNAAATGLEQSMLESYLHQHSLNKQLRSRLEKYDNLVSTARIWLDDFLGRLQFEDDTIKEQCGAASAYTVRQARTIPGHVCKILLEGSTNYKNLEEEPENSHACGIKPRTCENTVDSENDYLCNNTGRGRVYVYAADPKIQHQRISTVANAANSVNVALGIAASIPKSGVGLDAGIERLNSSVGQIDSIERTPIIVGFAQGEIQSGATRRSSIAKFGWVFGPPVKIDTVNNAIKFAHSVISQRVVVDVSVPAWWPYIDLKTNSSWVSGWKGKDNTLDNTKARERWIRVPLPIGSADMDALSDHARSIHFRQSHGAQTARIYDVHPSIVHGCGDVTFLLKGPNLWRDPSVYLNGQKHSTITVLPDMAGVAATINLQNINLSPNLDIQGANGRLTIVTGRGTDQYDLTIKRTCS